MKYLKHRLLFYIFSIWMISTIAFFCAYLLPGDTARITLGRQASEETLQAYREEAGLDLPMYRQYATFMNRLGHLDFGLSLSFRRPITELIKERALATVNLMFLAGIYVIIFSIILPLYLKWQNCKYLSTISESVCLFFGIMPPYVLGIISLIIVADILGWVSIIFEPGNLGAWFLPALVLAAYPISVIYRLFNNQMDYVVNSQYVLHSRALGFSEGYILCKEVLPNALTTSLPAFANTLAAFLTGTFFVEMVFGIPGLGRLIYEAISNKDISLLLILCILFAFTVTTISTLLEIAQRIIDPRLR
jgi:peptide/nickel transport system permease protein